MADETNRNVNEQPQAQDMGELLRLSLIHISEPTRPY